MNFKAAALAFAFLVSWKTDYFRPVRCNLSGCAVLHGHMVNTMDESQRFESLEDALEFFANIEIAAHEMRRRDFRVEEI
jgi:hypothetical protein